MGNTLCFFEIPGDDLEALKTFYGQMFDWGFEKVPGEFRYFSIETGDEKIKGGLTARQDAGHTPVNYVKVDSVQASLDKAKTLGATIVVPRKPVPGIGWYAVLTDPQGNRVGLWEDDPAAS
jgi:uncharacterized protein